MDCPSLLMPVFVVLSCSDDDAVSYELPVLWLTSCLFIQTSAAKGASHLHAGKVKYSEHMHVKQ